MKACVVQELSGPSGLVYTDFNDVVGNDELVSLGLKPPPPQRYPLSDAPAALQALADGGVFGKLVLEP